METTGERWGIGALPEEYKGVKAQLYDMTPVPILIHSWNGVRKWGTAELEVTVENLGSAVASDVYVLAGFDAGQGKLWNVERSPLFDMQVGEQVTITLNLKVPLGEHTRVVIQIADDDHAVDESYSEWFDT